MRYLQRSVILRLTLTLSLLSGTAALVGCGTNDLSRLHDILNKAAKAENAAAKTNHEFYEKGIYGTVGSAAAIALRQKAATVIHDSNEKLIIALSLAKGLTAATFEAGKLAVLQALTNAASGLTTGNAAIDLVLVTITTLVNQGVAIIQLFKSSDLWYVLPRIQAWHVESVNV